MKKVISQKLASRQVREISEEEYIPSAVLLLLFEKDDEYHVLFTRRSEKVEHHKGEISFPGGRVDEEDRDLLHTALREGEEEIGLNPEDIKILGRLDDFFTVATQYIVTPFVGEIPYPYEFRVSEDEIDELIEVPLNALARDCRVEAREMTWDNKTVTVYYYYYKDYVIWGATARILKHFLDLIF